MTTKVTPEMLVTIRRMADNLFDATGIQLPYPQFALQVLCDEVDRLRGLLNETANQIEGEGMKGWAADLRIKICEPFSSPKKNGNS